MIREQENRLTGEWFGDGFGTCGLPGSVAMIVDRLVKDAASAPSFSLLRALYVL